MSLAADARMPQVRALASDALRSLAASPAGGTNAGPTTARASGVSASRAHATQLADDIRRFLERPAASGAAPAAPVPPPGPPIGEPE
jgi:hypothetical protein